jgi:hypothetical protein
MAVAWILQPAAEVLVGEKKKANVKIKYSQMNQPYVIGVVCCA